MGKIIVSSPLLIPNWQSKMLHPSTAISSISIAQAAQLKIRRRLGLYGFLSWSRWVLVGKRQHKLEKQKGAQL
jgi:hypothetical protein